MIEQKNTVLNKQPESKDFFSRFVISVWILIALYTILYGVMGAYFASASVGIGVVILSPLTLFLEKKGYHKTARALFLIGCNFYIYATSLGFGHMVKIENYTVPALMLAILVNDFDDLPQILFGGSLPMLTWILTESLGVSILPQEWLYQAPNPKFFMAINFFGSYGLTTLFLAIFIRTIKKQRLSLITSAKMSSLGEMAGGIAHEINNPLGIITTRANQLKLRLSMGKLDNERLVEDLTKIESTTARIAKIIKGLRSFSRDSEKDPMINASLKEIIQDTLELSGERFRSKSIEIKLDMPQDFTILCRPTQLSQVFMNLLSNSIDAIETLPQPWIRITTTQSNDLLKIIFTDCGNGIPEQVVEKMMQPFFTTKDIGKGTGLGLSISKGIVESHNGRLYYDAASKNTCFILEMPLNTNQDMAIAN